jgi:oligopeptide transport system permease protein
MIGYAIRRLLGIIPLLFAVVTLTFFLMHGIDGGPFDTDRPLPAQQRARLEAAYNLDGSLGSQYLTYLGNVVQGDLGISFSNDRPVTDIIGERFPVSLHLGLYAFAFAILFGLFLGVISSLNQNGVWDYIGVFVATAGAALPSFILAPLLVWAFALKVNWFNVLSSDFGAISLVDWSWIPNDFSNWRQIVLPTLALGFLPSAFIARVTRASMLDVLRQDYIRTARSKGLGQFLIVMRHSMRNALIPVITIAGPIFAGLIVGSFIIERAFQIPGLGRSFVDSVLNRDYGVIMGVTLFFTLIITMMNLLVDMTYAFIDPRIRL